jgi:predicted DNA-binding transcriptional regulator AlpA
MESLVGLTEIAAMLDLSRSVVYKLTRQLEWPEPVAELGCGRIWLEEDVLRWARAAGRSATSMALVGLVAKKGNNPAEWADGTGGFVYAPPNARPSRRRERVQQPLLPRREFQRPPELFRDDVPAVLVGTVSIRQRVDESDEKFAERVERAWEYHALGEPTAELEATTAPSAES